MEQLKYAELRARQQMEQQHSQNPQQPHQHPSGPGMNPLGAPAHPGLLPHQQPPPYPMMHHQMPPPHPPQPGKSREQGIPAVNPCGSEPRGRGAARGGCPRGDGGLGYWFVMVPLSDTVGWNDELCLFCSFILELLPPFQMCGWSLRRWCLMEGVNHKGWE